MHFGLFAINYGTCGDPDTAIRVARHAEAAGLESVWTGEHLVLPESGPAISPRTPFLDTVVTLSALAVATEHIRLASGIIELPLAHPVTLAKQLASIDQLSRGRLIAGFGAGYVPLEFAAMGVALGERGARMDEFLAAMRTLWRQERPAFSGRFVQFDGVDAHPRPFRPDGPSIVLGGVSAPARRRAVTSAHGWYVFNADLDMTREAVGVIASDLRRYERPADLGRLEITVTPVGPFDRDVVEQYAELGVHRLVLLPRPDAPREERHSPVPESEILRTIDRVAELVDA